MNNLQDCFNLSEDFKQIILKNPTFLTLHSQDFNTWSVDDLRKLRAYLRSPSFVDTSITFLEELTQKLKTIIKKQKKPTRDKKATSEITHETSISRNVDNINDGDGGNENSTNSLKKNTRKWDEYNKTTDNANDGDGEEIASFHAKKIKIKKPEDKKQADKDGDGGPTASSSSKINMEDKLADSIPPELNVFAEGISFLRSGQIDKAINNLQEVVERNPDSFAFLPQLKKEFKNFEDRFELLYNLLEIILSGSLIDASNKKAFTIPVARFAGAGGGINVERVSTNLSDHLRESPSVTPAKKTSTPPASSSLMSSWSPPPLSSSLSTSSTSSISSCPSL